MLLTGSCISPVPEPLDSAETSSECISKIAATVLLTIFHSTNPATCVIVVVLSNSLSIGSFSFVKK